MLVVVAVAVLAAGCGNGDRRADWTLPNADLAGTRNAAGATIDAGNVASLRPLWRFRFRAPRSYSGIFASTPVATRDTVYVQDLRSNVFALDAENGSVQWEHRYKFLNDGPNGLALGSGRVYGETDSDAFALDAGTGHEL